MRFSGFWFAWPMVTELRMTDDTTNTDNVSGEWLSYPRIDYPGQKLRRSLSSKILICISTLNTLPLSAVILFVGLFSTSQKILGGTKCSHCISLTEESTEGTRESLSSTVWKFEQILFQAKGYIVMVSIILLISTIQWGPPLFQVVLGYLSQPFQLSPPSALTTSSRYL